MNYVSREIYILCKFRHNGQINSARPQQRTLLGAVINLEETVTQEHTPMRTRGGNGFLSTAKQYRRQRRFFLFMLSACSVLVMTSLQYRAQFLNLDREGWLSDQYEPRRMQERIYGLTSKGRTKEKTIRYLAVGQDVSSSTSYSKLLSRALSLNSASLFTVNSANAPLLAACTQSMVPIEEKGDVDIISVEIASTLDHSHHVLLRRLRRRFPTAHIILVETWKPMQSSGRMDNATQSGIRSGATTEKLESYIERDFLSGHEDILGEIEASMVSLPRPKRLGTIGSVSSASEFMHLFEESGKLSRSGDAVLASQLKATIEQHDGQPYGKSRHGDWGSGDSCNIWFDSGNYGNVESWWSHRVDFGLSQNSHRHALEFHKGCEDSITVDNPFPVPRMLHLTYMTSAEDDTYPVTRARLDGKPTVLIDPFHENQPEADFARTTAVGMLAPQSKTTLKLDPNERATTYPFRLVGASIVADEMSGYPIDFLIPDSTVKDSVSQWW